MSNKLLRKSREIAPERTDGAKQCPAVDVTSDESKVQCCKEHCCIGSWNVRYTTQGKLNVVNQEMARVNINSLGISERKWMGMGEY